MMPLRLPLRACLAMLPAFLSSMLLAGTTGKIAGSVVDAQTNEPLIGANVVLQGTTMGASSDVDGQYFILNIPPGKYTLVTSSVGYAKIEIGNVAVVVDQTTRIDFKLQSAAVQLSDVTVTAERPLVQRDLTSTVSSVSGDQLSQLPLEDVASVVNLQAGVVDGHFRGGRSNEVKYLIDGVAVNDVFSGGSTLQAEVNSIQEIQILSGTFNAEYGEALSGVVNQVTKIAGDSYEGEISGYTGDYVTSRVGLFKTMSQDLPIGNFPSSPPTGKLLGDQFALHRFSPFKLYNYQGSLSGPVPGTQGVLKFYLSGRKYHDEGYLYGRRIFNPSDSSSLPGQDPSKWYIGATGDGQYVPMNYTTRFTLQGKVSIDVGGPRGISLNTMYQDQQYRQYDQAFQLNPDGDYTYFQKSFLGSASYTQVISAAEFLDLSASVFTSTYKQYVYASPLDPPTDPTELAVLLQNPNYVDSRYVKPERMNDAGANAFLTGGTNNWHFNHNTQTYTGRADYTAQVTPIHQVKLGGEVDLHRLEYKDYQIHVDASSGFVPTLPVPGNFDFNFYTNRPHQIGAYIQDKIELSYLVVNLGVRFDYFQPDGYSLVNPDSIAGLDTLQPPYPGRLLARASAKSQFSPRIGISYPITDRGAVHISYGHFFQIPAFEFLYKNPNFRIPLTGNFPEFVGNTIGNADLQPQRTVMYEIGLQQELADNLGVTVTGYYKDIRNLLGLEIHIKNDFKKFGKYVNIDYGAVKGFTIALDRRMANGFGASIDYTLQFASGDASDPNDAYNKATASPPIDVNKVLVPLSWDRRHSLNATLTLGTASDFVISAIGRLGSGLPYTPSLQNQRTGLENSGTMPAFYNVDLYLTKYFTFSGYRFSFFLKFYNLFDTPNELNVFGDSGRAGYTLELTRSQQIPQGVNSLQQYFTRPDFYSAPRQVLLGASIGL